MDSAELHLFIEFAPIAAAMFDREMRYLAVSPRWMTDFGLEGSILGRSDYDVFPGLPEQWKQLHQRALAGEIEHPSEDKFTCPDGTIRWKRWERRPWRHGDGEIGGIIIFAEDITERKEAEEEARRTAERLSMAQSAAQIGIFEWDFTSNRTTVDKQYCDIFGLPPGTPLTYAGYLSMVHPEDRACIDAQNVAAFAAGGHIENECRIIRANDGAVRWIVAKGEVTLDERDRPTRLLGAVWDITERKRNEAAARETAGRLSLVQSAARIGVWEWNIETGESIASDVLLDLYGLPRGAPFTHASFMSLVHPDDRHLVEENARAAMNGKDVAIADQYRIVRANDGAIRWMTASGGFQFDKDGRPIFAMGVVYDITERKQVEIALRETSERLRLAQSAAHIGTWNWDVQADIAWFDDVGMEYLGLPQGVPIHYSDYVGRVPEEERHIVNSAVQAAFAGDGRVLLEHRLVNAQTGVARWVSCRGVFTFDDEGRPVHGAGAVYDITERKLAEEALRESEAEARRQHDELNWIYQNAPIGMCLLDRNLHYRRVNRWLAELNGAPMEAHIGRSVSEMAPDASDQIAQLVRQVVATGQPLKNYLIVRKHSPNSDAVRFLDASYFPLIDEHGEVSGFSVLLEEITDRKLAEEALRQSEFDARQQRDELDWIYRNAPIGLAYLDLDLRYRRINHWLANLSQRPVEEHIDLSVFDVVPQFARGAKMIKEWILATGEPVRNLEFSGEMPPKSGVVRHINSSWYPAFSEEGALAGFSVVVEELTERKRAEEALRRSEAKARKQRDELKWIYENAPIGLASLDKNLRFHSINRRLAEMNGLPIEAHIGRTVHEIVPSLSSKVEQLAHKIIATGEPVRNIELEGETAANPGVARYWDESWYPTFDSNGEIAGFSVVVEEVTESKHLQALREADRRKDEFLATLAHELRNPLAPIKNAIHLLQMLNHDDPTADQKRRVALSRAERQVTHLVRLVDDLLEVTRINHGKIELRKEPVELAAILSQAIDLSHSQIEAGPHQLIVELRSHSLPVEADPVRLAQVFANLLNNAAKFTEAGGRIDVIADREEGEAIVRVRDNGVGIPPEMASSIFDMFTQIKTGVRSGRGGIGIGLALARGIVQLHGGRIEARSAGLGHGSEFIVRLPLVVRQ